MLYLTFLLKIFHCSYFTKQTHNQCPIFTKYICLYAYDLINYRKAAWRYSPFIFRELWFRVSTDPHSFSFSFELALNLVHLHFLCHIETFKKCLKYMHMSTWFQRCVTILTISISPSSSCLYFLKKLSLSEYTYSRSASQSGSRKRGLGGHKKFWIYYLNQPRQYFSIHLHIFVWITIVWQ